jgi:hypothetical protein
MRAVIGDYILFDECIDSFREDSNGFLGNSKEDVEKTSYIMTDFSIDADIQLEGIIIFKSMRVDLPNAQSGFISMVKLPDWVAFNSESLFATALSSVISYHTGRVVKSPRNNYLSNRKLNDNDLKSLAIQNPVLVAGPGCVNTYISKERLSIIEKELSEIIGLLWNMPTNKYREFMYAIRLSALSNDNLRNDFALAYYLRSSSIESVAQIAIKRKSEKHPLESEWKTRAESDPEFDAIFQAYTQQRGNNQYLSKRFQEFILKYCPTEEWNELRHPMETNLENPYSSTMDYSHVTKKQWYEIYPEDLNEDEIKELLRNTYVYRSRFTHQGKNPPHKSPNDMLNRFFEKIDEFDFDTYTYKSIVLINYNLLSFINRKSITTYMQEISRK